MAKGADSKTKVFEQLQKMFPESFWNGPKEFRIPMEENGERVELKVTLTCAKENVGVSDSIDFSSSNEPTSDNNTIVESEDRDASLSGEPTEEEMENIKNLAEALGF